jgi:hypothetical protein
LLRVPPITCGDDGERRSILEISVEKWEYTLAVSFAGAG